MTKIKIRTPYNNPKTNSKEKPNDAPSLTQPDMTMPLKQLVKRFASGQAVPQLLPNFATLDQLQTYDPDPTRMSRIDREMYKKEVEERIEQYKAQLENQRKTIQEKIKELNRAAEAVNNAEGTDEGGKPQMPPSQPPAPE